MFELLSAAKFQNGATSDTLLFFVRSFSLLFAFVVDVLGVGRTKLKIFADILVIFRMLLAT